MQVPFSIEEFLGVFRAYNLGVWPAQIGLYGLGLLLVALALAGTRPVRRWGVAAGLAVLWAWMGAVYHLRFFVEINPAARGFGALFIAQAALWIAWAWRTPTLDFRPISSIRRLVGGGLLAYAFDERGLHPRHPGGSGARHGGDRHRRRAAALSSTGVGVRQDIGPW